MTPTQQKPGERRRFLKSAAQLSMAATIPAAWTRRAAAATELTISDNGSTLAPALRAAFYEPFEKETGIRITNVAHSSDVVTQFKVAVDTNSQIWDVVMITRDDVERLSAGKNYLSPIDVPPDNDLLPGMLKANWLGFSTYAVLFAYRTDKFPAGPASWRDFWDVQKFPGRRGMYRSPLGVLESALLADGVALSSLYPLDVDRAFKSLSKIRSSINVWWTNGAQNTQLLQSGEVDMSDTWNARAFAAIGAGAPVKPVWEGTYNADGWAIPAGARKLKEAQQFIRFCTRADRQAQYASLVANGPSNRKALGLIDPKRAELLPTSPRNFERLVARDVAWWGKNFEAVNERFHEWLLS